MAIAFLVHLAIFVVHGLICSAGVVFTFTYFTPLSQAVCDHLGLFGPVLCFVVKNKCMGAYAWHHLMLFGEWKVFVGRNKISNEQF
jgi:hypothetical protein